MAERSIKRFEKLLSNQYSFELRLNIITFDSNNIDYNLVNSSCSWNGDLFQFYDIETGTPIGAKTSKDNYPVSSYQQCINQAAQQPKSSNIICAWNGNYFSPFKRNNGSQLNRNPRHAVLKVNID